MNCNKDLHDGLKETGEIVCPFCDSRLKYIEKRQLKYYCCNNQNIINNNGMLVCKSCGVTSL